MGRDGFEVPSRRRPSAVQTCEQAAAAVLRTEAIIAARGHRLHSIGVTWSDDADTEASLLLRSLTDSGFDNVVPVRLPEATEALAWGIAEVIGHETTAVCVIEPEAVIALIVHTREGAVRTAVNHAIDSEEHLLRWLSAVFTRADWRPEALVVVGSGGDLAPLMPRLEDVLSVPVFAPAEAGLALARGAAVASAQNAEFVFAGDIEGTGERRSQDRRRPLAQTGALALLVAGVLTFVVSLSVAISLQLTPKNDSRLPEARPAADTSPRHRPPCFLRRWPSPRRLPRRRWRPHRKLRPSNSRRRPSSRRSACPSAGRPPCPHRAGTAAAAGTSRCAASGAGARRASGHPHKDQRPAVRHRR